MPGDGEGGGDGADGGAGQGGAGQGGAGQGGAGQDGAGGGAPAPITLPNLQPPYDLEVDSPGKLERWLDWKEAYERYLLLSDAKAQPDNFQAAVLLQSIGPEARKIYKGFMFSDGETKENPKTLIEKYDGYFLSETRDFIERLKFSRRVQKPLSDLRFLASTCNFCSATCRDNRIMDQILDGHKSETVKEKLTRSSKLDLKTTLNTCRAMELNEENKKVVINTSESEISKVSHYSGKKFEEKFCSRNHRMVKSECPAWGKTCNSCHKPNHFAGAEVCESGKSDVKSVKSDRKFKGSAASSSGSKIPSKSSKRGNTLKKVFTWLTMNSVIRQQKVL